MKPMTMLALGAIGLLVLCVVMVLVDIYEKSEAKHPADPPAVEWKPLAAPPSAPAARAKHCSKGCPCGNSCIDCSKTCRH